MAQLHQKPVLSQVGTPSSYSKHYKEFVCGYIAALINIAATFPINKVMFRQMLHGVSMRHAVSMLRKEGLRYLYRGCLPPLCQKTITVSLMFGTYSTYSSAIEETLPFSPKPVTLATAAVLAGTTEAILTPLERVQTLLQDRQFHAKFRNTYHVFRELGKYGIKEYYRGMSAILIRNGPSNILFFSLRGTIKDHLPKTDSRFGNLVEDFVTGSLVGAFTSTVCYPVNVAKTKMQVCYGTGFMSFTEACHQTYIERNRSIRKMFMGVHVNYTRAFISWGIINASHEFLKRVLFPEPPLRS